MTRKKYLITGGTGFVGRALYLHLSKTRSLRASTRNRSLAGSFVFNDVFEAFLVPEQDWTTALFDVEVVIHCAGRVHIMNELALDPLSEFRKVNVEGTLQLARQAAKSGVKRFIYLSSIKVNGEITEPGIPFSSDTISQPQDPYSLSKYEAEEELKSLAKMTGMELVIIRPPLVYGPGVGANFLSMMNWLWRKIPLPLSGVTKNRRSFIFIDNLISMIVACTDHPAAANQTFLVSDDEDISTSELLNRMALALGRPSKLFHVPVGLIALGAKIIGRSDIADRLCGSLQVDIKKTKDLLGWRPPVSVSEGLRQTAAYFIKMQS